MPFGQGADVLKLLSERVELEREFASMKGRLTQLNEKILAAAKPSMDAAFIRERKTDGTVKFAVDNHIFRAVVTKRVDWDSDQLKEIAATMPRLHAEDFFKITYAVPEATWRVVADHELKAKLTKARTVKYGDPRISNGEG